MNEPQYKPITGMINVNDIQEIIENNRYYQEEIKRLNKGYCELKEKCNKGECDCTNEEYISMCEANIKLYLEVDKLNKIIEIKTNRIQDLMNRLSKKTERIDKAIEYIENTYIGSILEVHSGYEEEYTKPLLDILKGSDKE